jgi:drug/metabolite transporter (DMT)-like permease
MISSQGHGRKGNRIDPQPVAICRYGIDLGFDLAGHQISTGRSGSAGIRGLPVQSGVGPAGPWCGMRGLPMRFARRDHLFIALQGTCLFAVNYWLFYLAEVHLTSGIVAVMFSTIVFWNILNGRIFLKTPVRANVICGACLGITGIGLVFWPELSGFSLADDGFKGFVLSMAATLMASFGNILSARNQRHGLPVVQTNAFGMAYGTLLMLAAALIAGKPFTVDPSAPYMISLLYLALFGSVIAFGCYLTLVGKIGADRASYATLLFPIIALIISTLFEGYRWSPPAVAGVAVILAGNALSLAKIDLPAIRSLTACFGLAEPRIESIGKRFPTKVTPFVDMGLD